VVWHFPAEDSTVLAAEFARLAGQLGIGGGLLDRRDPVASVHAMLAVAATLWLLVFDNASICSRCGRSCHRQGTAGC
jgi:hypothetical protein